MAAAMKGQVDQIILTGGIAHGQETVDALKGYVSWIAPVTVYPARASFWRWRRALCGCCVARRPPKSTNKPSHSGHGVCGAAADPVFLYAFRWSVHRPLYHKSTVCVKF